MAKVAVVYWTQTGNTEVMANKIVEAVKANGSEADLFTASEFAADKMDQYDAVAFGCPAMGDEELETDEFLPMWEDCSAKLSGKKIGIFGSYGWGDGEWMRLWEKQCEELGAVLVVDPVLANYEPDDDSVADCEALGKALTE